MQLLKIKIKNQVFLQIKLGRKTVIIPLMHARGIIVKYSNWAFYLNSFIFNCVFRTKG